MASLDWNKSNQNKKIQDQKSNNVRYKKEQSDFWVFLEKGLWPVKGKHKGKPIVELNESYLQWIEKNFKGIPKKIASKELERRQKKKNST